MAVIKMKVDNSKINEIADAIREKTGTTQEYTLDEMPDAILNIPSGGDNINGFIINGYTTPNIIYGNISNLL